MQPHKPEFDPDTEPDSDLEPEIREPELSEPGELSEPADRFPLDLHQALSRHWRPEPIEQPMVDTELPRLSWPERCAEALAYALRRFEYWLSPGGALREWLRITFWCAAVLLTIALLIAPPLTAVLANAVAWSASFAGIVANIASGVGALPPIALCAAVAVLVAIVIRRIRQRRQGYRGGSRSGFDDYN